MAHARRGGAKTARPKVKEDPRASGERVAERKNECAICHQPHSVKYVIKLLPCSHVFHRTCAIERLEAMEREREQTCPICSVRVREFEERGTILKNLLIPFGRIADPTRRVIFLYAHLFKETEVQLIISWLNERNRAETHALQLEYRESDPTTAQISDKIDRVNENAKLVDRGSIYREMQIVFRQGNLQHDTIVARRWHYSYEKDVHVTHSIIDYDDVNSNDEEDSLLCKEYVKFRQTLTFTPGQVPTSVASHVEAVTAGMYEDYMLLEHISGVIISVPRYFLDFINVPAKEERVLDPVLDQQDAADADAAGFLIRQEDVDVADETVDAHEVAGRYPHKSFAAVTTTHYRAALAVANQRRVAEAAAGSKAGLAMAQPLQTDQPQVPARHRKVFVLVNGRPVEQLSLQQQPTAARRRPVGGPSRR